MNPDSLSLEVVSSYRVLIWSPTEEYLCGSWELGRGLCPKTGNFDLDQALALRCAVELVAHLAEMKEGGPLREQGKPVREDSVSYRLLELFEP